jgi:DNA-nicking Smr family endonuclease
MSRRPLSDEERALWSGFTRSITPLQNSRPVKSPVKAPAGPASKRSDSSETATHAQLRPSASRVAPAAAATSPPLMPLGRRLKQRVARGREPIGARLDLHGLTQRQAHDELLRFLRYAQEGGAKVALVVTGKGSVGREAASERGVLRRQVPLWLALPEFRRLIVGFEDAHASHGGQGALYVRLRRGQ